MPRFIVQRTFPHGLNVIPNENGAKAMLSIVGRNAEKKVTWVHSYVSLDKSRTFCVYSRRKSSESPARRASSSSQARVFTLAIQTSWSALPFL